MKPYSQSLSGAARARMLSLPREPLFIADWMGVVMIHIEVDSPALQTVTPFPLDLWEGRAFVSAVAFSLRGMRLRFGGRLGALLCTPLATHQFLNLRTYVRHGDETGIHFLAEWLNSRLAVHLGPRMFGLPYRLGRIEYDNDGQRSELSGRVEDTRSGAALTYRAVPEAGVPGVLPCAAGSLDEWLMERYTAFNCIGGASVAASRGGGRSLSTAAREDARPTGTDARFTVPGGRRRFFRVWHEPWLQRRVELQLTERTLLTNGWPFFREAKLIGANWSPGVRGVWMGWPHTLCPEPLHGLSRFARMDSESV